MILSCLGIFILGSIGCAVAPSLFALIGARAVQGLGGGGLIALALTIIGDVVAPRERAKYQGYFSGVWALSSVAGPGLGGLLAEHLHWSMIFWLNLPLAALAIVVMDRPLRLLQAERQQHRLGRRPIRLAIRTDHRSIYRSIGARYLARIPSAACLRTIAPNGRTSESDRLSGIEPDGCRLRSLQ